MKFDSVNLSLKIIFLFSCVVNFYWNFLKFHENSSKKSWISMKIVWEYLRKGCRQAGWRTAAGAGYTCTCARDID